MFLNLCVDYTHCGLESSSGYTRELTTHLSPCQTPEVDRLADLHANFEGGNHQSGMYNFEQLVSMITEEVQQGWQLILLHRAALELQNSVLAPLRLVDQDCFHQ